MPAWLSNTRIILLAACLVRLAVILITGFVFTERAFLTDSEGYINIAHNIQHHGVFSQETEAPFLPDLMRTPVYPALLFLFNLTGNGILIMLLVQLLLSVATCYFVIRITQTISQHSGATAISGWLMALDIPSVIFTGFILTETVFTFLLTAFLWFTVRYFQHKQVKHVSLASVLLGAAILCRPIVLFLPFFVFIFFLLSRKHVPVKHTFIFLLPVLFLTCTWILRNKLVFNELFFTRIGTFNMAWFQASMAKSEAEHKHINDARWEIFSKAAANMERLPAKDPVTFYHKLAEVSRQEICNHPGIVLKNILKAEVNLLLRPATGYTAHIMGQTQLSEGKTYVNTPVLVTLTAFQIVCLFLLYFGIILLLWNFKKINIPVVTFFLIVFIYFLLPGTGPEMDARFRIPLFPVLVILSATGWKYLFKVKAA